MQPEVIAIRAETADQSRRSGFGFMSLGAKPKSEIFKKRPGNPGLFKLGGEETN